ncbi:nucleotide exchange factor GrpE [Marinomonas piezotolerans]|uniref:Protein GrpE n=1 Tax=Marinomonas piezotolerans TaxID=2213058 RepID=A0A370U4N7_9GAMM|nr:nucleotide exchange factor GrpE [Marinomonas piezotolerans]RDL42744.1 nucleotide exchange factor GrpE [Marinomonas piezotolerans]
MSDQPNKANQEVEQDELLNEAEAATAEEGLEEVQEAEASDELTKALEDVAMYREAALRAQADAQNVRRRAELDVEKAHKFALEKFAKSVITVADNLERALSSTEEGSETDPMREGVELTYKDLMETLARFEVVAVDPAGEPFNPELHQAMTMVPNPNMEPNTVMDVVQKGYTLNGRLLRPAMVVVSSAA